MNKVIEKALKEIKDAIDNVEGRYFHNNDDSWQIDDLTLLASLEAAKRELEAAQDASVREYDYAIISEDQTVLLHGRSTQDEAETKAKEIANEHDQIVMVALVIEEVYPDDFWSGVVGAIPQEPGVSASLAQGGGVSDVD